MRRRHPEAQRHSQSYFRVVCLRDSVTSGPLAGLNEITHTQNVRHLVLEVLGGDQWVQQLLAALDHGVNLTTATAKVRVVIECFPQVVDGLAPGLCTRINQDADRRLRKT